MDTNSPLQNDVVAELKWDYEMPNDEIMVKDGWVAPKDTIEEQFQRDAAVRCALHAVFSGRHNHRHPDGYRADDEMERYQKRS